MRKYLGVLAIIISLFFGLIKVNAANSCNSGLTENSAEFSSSNYYSLNQELVYEIAYVDMSGDWLNLYGWAFITGVENYLGNPNSAGYTQVSFALAKSPSDLGDSQKSVEFDISYAQPSDNNFQGLKFYDTTYWNCTRIQTSDTVNGKCAANSVSIQGGFKASVNLTDSRLTNGAYKVYMKVYSKLASKASDNGKWIEVGASEQLISNNVKTYNQPDKIVSIAGFSNTATVKVSKGRLLAKAGGFCGSVAKTNPGATYFNQKSHKIVEEKLTTAYKGPNDNKYYIHLYPLDVSSYTTIDKSKGTIAYAPASWLKFDGSITVNIKDPIKYETPVPANCEGKQIYNNYYLFLAGMGYNNPSKEDSQGIQYMRNSAKSSKYNDAEIFRLLGINSLNEISYAGGIYDINATNVVQYYNWLERATSTSQRYYQDGNNFYIAHMTFCSLDASGKEVACYNSSTGCKLDADGNETSECPSSKKEVINGTLDLESSLKATIPAVSLSISQSPNASNNGYQFTIVRGFDNRRYMMTAPSTKAIMKDGQFLHPAVYQIAYCKTDTSSCNDTVNSAYCDTADTGTKVVFHENDDLQTCTLEKNNHSGFTIIEKEETTPSPYKNVSYCEVACKDNLDIELPTTKETAAGQYFTLDNYTPKISAKRTCITSEIKYDTFMSDMKDTEESMVKLYNTKEDYKHIKEALSSRTEAITEISNAANELAQIYNTKKQKEDDKKELENEIKELEDVIKELKNQLQNTTDNTKKENLNNKISDKEEALKTLKDDLKELENDLNDLYDKETDAKKSVNNVNTQYRTIAKEVVTNGTGSCTIGSGSTKTECTYSWTTYSWEIYSIGLVTGRDRSWTYASPFGGDSGSRTERSGCSCASSSGTRLSTRLNELVSEYSSLESQYDNMYSTQNNNYSAIQGLYNLCSSNQKNSWLTNSYYQFSFKPTVTFDYDDQDGIIFPTVYSFDYDKDVDKQGFDTQLAYWKYGENADSNYSNSSSNSPNICTNYNLLNCVGNTCSIGNISSDSNTNCKNATGSSRTKTSAFVNNSYIKREESVTYTYHLPTVYTIVPSGVVTTNRNETQTKLTLEDNSVPVNINTVGGTYNYSLKITDIDDDLRKNKKSKNPDDDFQDRFNQTALNAGDEYICNYKVVNDIYVPGDNPYLNFFYRTVDMADINPNNRDLGYNWSDSRAQEVMRRMQETAADYQVLTSSSHDVFSFTLTPAIMKEIRNYNATKHNVANGSYSDFDLECHDYGEGGYHCDSNFLTCLTSGGGTNIQGQASCTNIFGNSLTNYNSVSNYDYTALRNNRQLLIDKQNRLDGR